MPIDVERMHERTLPDGSTYDVYLPTTYTRAQRHRLLVSTMPSVESGPQLLPRYASTDRVSAIAEARGDVVLAPRLDMASRFQLLGLGTSVRFDLRLLDAVRQAGDEFNLETAQFDLYGYSAGGQFAHRFLYLHPERLAAAAIGAPGSVTLPSLDYPWPWGWAGLHEASGLTPDLAAVRQPRILLFVGDRDTTNEGTVTMTAAEADRFGFGQGRLQRVQTLHQAWLSAGIPHTYVEIAGMEHRPNADAGALVQRFFVGD